MLTLHQFIAYCKRHNLNSIVISASYMLYNDECIGESIRFSHKFPDEYARYHEDYLSYDTIRALSPEFAYYELQYAFVTPDELVKSHMHSLMPKRALFLNNLDELPF